MGTSTALEPALADVRRRIGRAGKEGLNEQNTKATLIEPVLRALGWNVEEPDEVVREFRIKSRDKPVDYGLLVLREPRLFVEAKPLGGDLNDRRWANQIMGYASVAGVEWIVLTNGDEWRIYNTHATVPVDEKLFRSVRATDTSPIVAETLALLSKSQLDAHRIDALWKAHFIDRRVRAALENLFSRDNDMVLVNHVLAHAKNLSADDVRASLRRCKAQFDFPLSADDILVAEKPRRTKKAAVAGGERKQPARYDVTVKQLIDAGILKPPVPLSCRFKGHDLRARIEKDGSVSFGDKRYRSLSVAASVARGTAGSRRPDGSLHATNGWAFWKCRALDGELREIDRARRALLGASASHASTA